MSRQEGNGSPVKAGNNEEVFRVGSVQHGFTCSRVSLDLEYPRTYVDRGKSPWEHIDRNALWESMDHVVHSSHFHEMQWDEETRALFTWVKNKTLRSRGDSRSREHFARDLASRASAVDFHHWPRILSHRRCPSDSLKNICNGGGQRQSDGNRTVVRGGGSYCPLTEAAIARLQSWFSHLIALDTTCSACLECESKPCFMCGRVQVPGRVLKRLSCQEIQVTGPHEDTSVDTMRDVVDAGLSPDNMMDAAARATAPSIRSVRPWLDDQILDAYIDLIHKRSLSKQWQGQGGATIAVFSSYLYTRLMGGGEYNYCRVSTWGKRMSVLDCDYVFVPINHGGSHWSLCVVYARRHLVHHIDSQPPASKEKAENVAKWYAQRLRENHKQIMPDAGLRVSTSGDVPRQHNSADCGVYVCKSVDFISKDLPLDFTDDHMPYFRARIAHELLVGKVD